MKNYGLLNCIIFRNGKTVHYRKEMVKMKKLLCTLFAAAVVAAMSAVTAFAEDNLVFVKTTPAPNEFTEFAKNVFDESQDVLVGVGLTEAEAKSAVLGNSFVIKDVDDTDENNYQFPIFCSGKTKAVLTVSDLELENSKYKYFFEISQSDIMKNLNDLTTSPADPAEIYISGGFVFAVTNDEFTLLEAPNGYKKEEMEKAKAKIENISSGEDSLDEEYVINVYGCSKTGWITVDGSKYFIKKNCTLAIGNLVIGSKRYKFGEDGKYLGTFTGFVQSGGKRSYYKDGVKQTGDFTVNGKPYRTDKNGNILTDEKPVYIKTAPVPKEAAAYANDIFEHLGTYDLTSIGLTKAEAKSAKLGSPFVITSLSSNGKPVDTAECYYCPIMCGGEAKAFLIVHKDDDGKFGWQLGIEGIEEKFNSLDTSHDDPAEIYYVDEICIAVTNNGMTVLSGVSNYDASPQTAALEKLRSKNTFGDFVINVYGNSRVSV